MAVTSNFLQSPLSTPKGYKTQSFDTQVEAELLQFQLWRQMTSRQKYQLLKRVLGRSPQLILSNIAQQFPDATPEQIRSQYILKRLGKKWADKWADILCCCEYSGELVMEDSLWLAHQLARLLAELQIPYYIGGSIASSLQGEVRYTEDLDLVVHLQSDQVRSLIDAMAGQFYISEVAVTEAISGKTSSFNVIHLETTEKADFFIMGEDEFAKMQMARRQLYMTGQEPRQAFYLCSPEDIVLQKLLGYRMTQQQSEKQWRDILGVLKLQGERLDFNYLWVWAEKLNLLEEIDRAFTEAGL